MSVTGEQWAQAEAERWRQTDKVQTLINEVRRLGTEQNNSLQEVQRVRAEQFLPTPPVDQRTVFRKCFSCNSFTCLKNIRIMKVFVSQCKPGHMLRKKKLIARERQRL